MTVQSTWFKKAVSFRVKSFERKTIGKTWEMYKNINKSKKSIEKIPLHRTKPTHQMLFKHVN